MMKRFFVVFVFVLVCLLGCEGSNSMPDVNARDTESASDDIEVEDTGTEETDSGSVFEPGDSESETEESTGSESDSQTEQESDTPEDTDTQETDTGEDTESDTGSETEIDTGTGTEEVDTNDYVAPQVGDLVITEIMYHPEYDLTESKAEWVEIFNKSDKHLILDGCTIKSSDPYKDPLDGIQVAPGGFVLVGRDHTSVANGGLTLDGLFYSSLRNLNGQVTIECVVGIMDFVSYDGGNPGHSISLHPDHIDETENDIKANWCDSIAVYYADTTNPLEDNYGTPGQTNEVCAACMPDTCNDHGNCDDSGVGVVCSCIAGYTGERCDGCDTNYHDDGNGNCIPDATTCDLNCGVHGDCQINGGVQECVCNVGYEGTSCNSCASGYHPDGAGGCAQDDTCLADTCNHGDCSVNSGAVTCECDAGYEGDYCDQCAEGYHPSGSSCIEDETCTGWNCNNGHCELTGGIAGCVCDSGYEGTYCAGCASGYHMDGSSCVQDDNCQPDTCSNNGNCSINGGLVECDCDSGYAGTYCDRCDADYHNPGNGTCVPDETCSGWNCGTHGSCVVTDGVAGCECQTGYTGTNCESCASGYHDVVGVCVIDDTCTLTTCSDHGSCSIPGGVISCSCDAGYQGTYCDECATDYHPNGSGGCDPDETCSGVDCGGAIHGSCVINDGIAGCDCNQGYTGNNCENCSTGYHLDNGNCVVDEQCLSGTCNYHASACIVVDGIALCTCNAGYAGDHCEACAFGYHLDGAICVLDDDCGTWDCNQPNGTCYLDQGIAMCQCEAGYDGADCYDCADGYELDGGLCIEEECPLNSGYPCACDDVYCGNGDTCLVVAQGASYGFCSPACTTADASPCVDTQGYGMQGNCMFITTGNDTDPPDHCGVICEYGGSSYSCPPNTNCIVDSGQGYCAGDI